MYKLHVFHTVTEESHMNEESAQAYSNTQALKV